MNKVKFTSTFCVTFYSRNSHLLVFSGFVWLLLFGSCPEQQSTHLQGFRCTYPNSTSFSLVLKQEQTKKLYLAFFTVSCTLLRVLSIELCFSIFKMSILNVTSSTHTLTLRLLYDLKQSVALNHNPGENLLFKAFRSRLWRLFFSCFLS